MSKTYRIKWREGEATLHHDRGITTGRDNHKIRQSAKDFYRLINFLQKSPFHTVTEI